MSEITRTVSADLGLLSPEELLKSHKGGRRQSLEDEIRQASFSCKIRHTPWRLRCRDGVRYFLDNAHIKISVSYTDIKKSSSTTFQLTNQNV